MRRPLGQSWAESSWTEWVIFGLLMMFDVLMKHDRVRHWECRKCSPPTKRMELIHGDNGGHVVGSRVRCTAISYREGHDALDWCTVDRSVDFANRSVLRTRRSPVTMAVWNRFREGQTQPISDVGRCTSAGLI